MKLFPSFAVLAFIVTTANGFSAPARKVQFSETTTSLAIVIRAADPGSKFLAAEYARDLIYVFGGIKELAVVPRARVLKAEVSNEAPAYIGRALPATHVLFAVVQVADDAFVFSAELIESNSNLRRWQETIRGKLAEGAGVAGEIGRLVTRSLGLAMPTANTRESHITTANPIAWRAYLNGRQAMDTITAPSLVEATGHFERAVAADSNFAVARVGLATVHIALGYNFRKSRVHFTQARECLTQLTPAIASLPEAAMADAVLKFYHERDWHAAARGAHLVTNSDPSAAETHACFLHCAQTLGGVHDGQNEIAAAHRAQPDSMAIRSELSCSAYYARKFEDAEREARAALELDAENPIDYWSLARSLVQQGKFESARTELKRAQSKPGGDWAGILAEVAYLEGRQDRRAEAAQVIAQMQAREKNEYIDPYLFAMVYAGLGDTAEICRQLEQAAANESPWIPNVALDPKFVGLKNEPRFRALLIKLNLAME
jgi:tetratricopeptide (TPR) repeat protein